MPVERMNELMKRKYGTGARIGGSGASDHRCGWTGQTFQNFVQTLKYNSAGQCEQCVIEQGKKGSELSCKYPPVLRYPPPNLA